MFDAREDSGSCFAHRSKTNGGRHVRDMMRASIASSCTRVPDTNEGVDDDEDSEARGVVGPRSTAAGMGRALNDSKCSSAAESAEGAFLARRFDAKLGDSGTVGFFGDTCASCGASVKRACVFERQIFRIFRNRVSKGDKLKPKETDIL
jgi:hypothetical protein